MTNEAFEANKTPEKISEEKKMSAMFRASKHFIDEFNTELKEEESKSVSFDPATSPNTWEPISKRLLYPSHQLMRPYISQYEPLPEKEISETVELLNLPAFQTKDRRVSDRSLLYLHAELIKKINEQAPTLQNFMQETTKLEEKMQDNQKRAEISCSRNQLTKNKPQNILGLIFLKQHKPCTF